MNKLPEEMLRAVFVYLPGSDLLPVSLTCRRWFNLLKDSVPSISAIHISLDISACSTRLLEASLSEAALAEGMETQIPDMTVHALLNSMPKCLRALHFQGVDFSKVRPWTFALLVKFKSLEELYILDAVLPIDNESLFARMISPSFDTLTNISVTNNAQITDKFVSTLARRCPILQTVNLNGCKRITSLSVLAFAENASHRITELTFIHVQATMFNPNLLQRYLSSPLLTGGNYWRANALKLEIGFQHDAICLENICRTNLSIIVFI
uniref:F-box domain-containing protein n=1 Tax=Loa loa TaxID=7209 RepID=A0A1I7VK58_LOALO